MGCSSLVRMHALAGFLLLKRVSQVVSLINLTLLELHVACENFYKLLSTGVYGVFYFAGRDRTNSKILFNNYALMFYTAENFQKCFHSGECI